MKAFTFTFKFRTWLGLSYTKSFQSVSEEFVFAAAESWADMRDETIIGFIRR